MKKNRAQGVRGWRRGRLVTLLAVSWASGILGAQVLPPPPTPPDQARKLWYYCSACDSFEQVPIPKAKFPPEMEQLEQEVKSYLADWWL